VSYVSNNFANSCLQEIIVFGGKLFCYVQRVRSHTTKKISNGECGIAGPNGRLRYHKTKEFLHEVQRLSGIAETMQYTSVANVNISRSRKIGSTDNEVSQD
jgi:hypothetical protein